MLTPEELAELRRVDKEQAEQAERLFAQRDKERRDKK